MVPIYRVFARDFQSSLDFSEDMLYEMYEYESRGSGTCSQKNGYFHGKKWMDVTVAMWVEDLRLGNLFSFELYEDDKFPGWWLDRVLANVWPITKERALILEPSLHKE